jgi:hypothetical protein
MTTNQIVTNMQIGNKILFHDFKLAQLLYVTLQESEK